MKQITSIELKSLMERTDVLLLDVREGWERDAFNIGGMHIPMSELPSRYREIPMDKEVIVYCEKGIRSTIVIQRLEASGFTNLINLSGGMKEWRGTRI
ncbi:MAG: rhodanese-like domain-containing protein [Taibaiella sp.]|nr:rhodanese-like domain-containing protein [Taibaiella sp.]